MMTNGKSTTRKKMKKSNCLSQSSRVSSPRRTPLRTAEITTMIRVMEKRRIKSQQRTRHAVSKQKMKKNLMSTTRARLLTSCKWDESASGRVPLK